VAPSGKAVQPGGHLALGLSNGTPAPRVELATEPLHPLCIERRRFSLRALRTRARLLVRSRGCGPAPIDVGGRPGAITRESGSRRANHRPLVILARLARRSDRLRPHRAARAARKKEK